MFGRGFKYGMLVQLAVGPVSLLVFKTAGTEGFGMGLVLVLAVALVDAAFIAFASLGSVYLLKCENVQAAFKAISSIILILFGISTILGAFHLSVLPEISLFNGSSTGGVFLEGVLLTASNPLTILFWNSLISSQVSREKMNKAKIFWFGAGCVLSTVVFLTFISALGTFVDRFLPETVTMILNIAVGFALVGYGISLMIRRRMESRVECAK